MFLTISFYFTEIYLNIQLVFLSINLNEKMVIKAKKRQRKSKLSQIPYSTKEKLILILFLVFVILAITILFRGAPESQYLPMTGTATLTSELTETSYGQNDEFDGSIKLMLQQGDILPPNTEIHFLVYTNKPKCSKYICENNIPVDWYDYDEGTEQCILSNPDPEGKCCLIMGAQCKQIILNSGFEELVGGFPTSWLPYVLGLGGEAAGIETYPMDPLGQNYSSVAYTDSSGIYQTGQGQAAFHQNLGNRAAPIFEFRISYTPVRNVTLSSETYESENELSFDGLSYQVSQVPDPLTWKVHYDKQYYYTGCAFELVVQSVEGRNLHYYYVVNGSVSECQRPADTSNDRYIPKILPVEGNWTNESADLYADWIAGTNWPATDRVKEIWIISHGIYLIDAPISNAQIVRWDDIKLTKTRGTIPMNLCEARGKRCCAEGTGFGDYFGLQLECDEGKECWTECADSIPLHLTQFIQKSTTDNKKNMTSGLFTYIKDPSQQTEEEYSSVPPRCTDSKCLLMYDYGSGFTACLDESTHSCEDWDNTYELPLDELTHFKTPGENGTYELVVKIQYEPSGGNCGQILDPETNQYKYIDTCLMYEIHEPFSVGEVCDPVWDCTPWEPYPCTDKQTRNCTESACGLGSKTYERTCCSEDWQCDDWSACVGNVRTRTCTDLNNCSTTYELNDTWADPECAALPPCTVADWSCTDWQPTICPTEGIQIRTCDLIGTCDTTTGYVPEEEKTCIIPEPEKPQLGWLLYVIIGIIILAALIFVLQKFVFKARPKTKKETSPELVSYVRDALATGATKAEIRAKLSEAGWPKDAIQTALRYVK